MLNSRNLYAGAALSCAVFLASEARAGTADCSGWAVLGNWGSTAYAVAQSSLRQHTSLPLYTFTVMETNRAEGLITNPYGGALALNGAWRSIPLNGSYSAQFSVTIYAGLNHYPTPEELASWPAAQIFRLN